MKNSLQKLLPQADEPIFIIGHNRSGTSMVAGLLASMGVWTGICLTVENRNPLYNDNPKGFWENQNIRKKIVPEVFANSRIELAMMKKGYKPDEFKDYPDLFRWVIEDIGRAGYEQGPWLYKDCKLSVAWKPFVSAFPRAIWIYCKRPCEDIVQSCLDSYVVGKESQDRNLWTDRVEDFRRSIHELALEPNVRFYTVYPDLLVNGQFEIFKAMLTDIGMEWPKLPRRQKLPDAIYKDLWHASPRVSR